MVATKTTDSDHDFENDPLDLFVDGDLIGAKNTTLGGDDGIAVAYAMAILASTDIRIHRSRLYLQSMKRSVWAVHITSIHPY